MNVLFDLLAGADDDTAVVAPVVLRPGAETDERQLRMHCAAAIAEFKVPRRIHILAELPRGPTGKLQRIAMARLLDLVAQAAPT